MSARQQTRFLHCAVRLLQDDDSETREKAYGAARSNLVEGKAVEELLRAGGDHLEELLMRDEQNEFSKYPYATFIPLMFFYGAQKLNLGVHVL